MTYRFRTDLCVPCMQSLSSCKVVRVSLVLSLSVVCLCEHFPLEAEAGLMDLISWLLAISFGLQLASICIHESRTENRTEQNWTSSPSRWRASLTGMVAVMWCVWCTACDVMWCDVCVCVGMLMEAAAKLCSHSSFQPASLPAKLLYSSEAVYIQLGQAFPPQHRQRQSLPTTGQINCCGDLSKPTYIHIYIHEELEQELYHNSISAMAGKSENVQLAKEFLKSVDFELQTKKRGKSQVLYLRI